jgi:hypothetical protein
VSRASVARASKRTGKRQPGGTTASDREAPAAVDIFCLLANGHVTTVCRIESGAVEQTYNTVQRLPAMGSFLATIRGIGVGGEDEGTMHSGQAHDAQAPARRYCAACVVGRAMVRYRVNSLGGRGAFCAGCS